MRTTMQLALAWLRGGGARTMTLAYEPLSGLYACEVREHGARAACSARLPYRAVHEALALIGAFAEEG